MDKNQILCIYIQNSFLFLCCAFKFCFAFAPIVSSILIGITTLTSNFMVATILIFDLQFVYGSILSCNSIVQF